MSETLKLNGVTAFVFSVRDKGKEITISGFSMARRRFKEGADLILEQKNGETTRYRIKKTEFPSDPDDQFFLDCTFNPR